MSTERIHENVGAIEFALTYSFTNPESKYGSVLKGIAALVASVLVVPFFTFFGCALRLREAAARGEPEAPLFVEWWDLTTEGFFGFLALIPLSLPFGFGLGIGFTLVDESPALGGLVLLATYLLFFYLFPAVLTVYAVERDIRTVYTTPKVVNLAFTSTYLVGSLLYVVLAVALVVIYFVSALALVGPLLVAPFLVYSRHTFWGYVYWQVTRGSDETGGSDGMVPTAAGT